MTVKELHIGIDERLQILNSEAFDDIRPEQKDLALNRSVERFIKNRLNPKSNSKGEGYSATKKRYKDIQDLISTKTLDIYKETSDIQFSLLPFDCFEIIRADVNVKSDCKSISNTLSETNVTEYLSYVKLLDAPITLYANLKVIYTNGTGSTTLFDIADYPDLVIYSSIGKFVLIDLILYEINRNFNNIKVYWEKYDNIYKPNNFIISTFDSTNINITFEFDTISISSFTPKVLTKINSSISKEKSVDVRLIEGERLRDILNHPFATTKSTSPIANFSDNRLKIYRSSNFIISSISLEYIRIPRKINIYLNHTCELNEIVHNEIIDMTVESLAKEINASNTNGIANDNLKTE